MRDLLHDLVMFVSLKECCVYDFGNWRGDPETCHHLSITESHNLLGNLTEHLRESMKLQLEHVRTPTIDSFEKASEILKSMKRVRVVKVLECTSRVYSVNEVSLQDIGHLIHLRYLDLSRNKISNVPESICKLYHLQTVLFNLEVRIRIPEQMCNLVNLHYLVAHLLSITSIPFIGKLSQLQGLKYFNCEYNNIGQLIEMNELGGELHIMNMESIDSTYDAESARMYKKRRLKMLKLVWSFYSVRPAKYHDAVLECVRPNEQLEELQITGHPGCKPPSWIAPSSLTYIQHIYLCKCSYWHNLSVIAKLPHLEYLSMISMRLVNELGDEDTFPSLMGMHLQDVSISFKKSRVHGMTFPRLQEMSLIYCEKLEGLTMPLPLKNLTIKRSDVELLVFLNGLSCLTTLIIFYQDRFTSFDREVMDSLSSLTELAIR